MMLAGAQGDTWEERIENTMVQWAGAYSLVILTRDGVLAAMSECDALVVASRFETFSVVLIEALALGKPVIATRCGGPESIVSPQDGLLVDPGSVEAMASALSELHSSSFNFEPEGIRARCIARFGRAALTTRLMKIYDSVVNREDHHG